MVDCNRVWRFNFGLKRKSGAINVTADMKFSHQRGFGFLGLGSDGYLEDERSDGFTMIQGQKIVLQDTDYGVAVTDPSFPIRFAVLVEPNTYYKVKLTLTSANLKQVAKVNLFSEKRHLHLLEKAIPAGEHLDYEFNVNVQDVYSKRTGVYRDEMLNVVICGENAAISSMEIQQLKEGRTLWVLGDSTVCDQAAPLPYFPLQNYAGVGQALTKYLSKDLAVSNHGEGGLETNSSRPHFYNFRDRILPGDFVWFQFGHNHKEANGALNYYRNIAEYYDFIRGKGAKFIVVGPIDRHTSLQYNQQTNTWSSTLATFSEMGKRFVEKQITKGHTDIAFVDLNAPSLKWYGQISAQLGRGAKSTDFYFRGFTGSEVDKTHPNDAGVDNFAAIFFDFAKDLVSSDSRSVHALVLADLIAGLRSETPYIVPDSIIALGNPPNAAYPRI